MSLFTNWKKISCSLCILAVSASASWAGVSDEWSADVIKGHMKKLTEWQLAHPKGHHKLDWTYGAFYAGLAAYGNMDPDGPGFKAIRKVGEEHKWGHKKRLLHADDHCVGQAFIEVGIYDQNPAAIEKIRALLDYVMANCNPKASLEFGKTKDWHNRWAWVDALFMSPTVFTKMYGYTGERKYLEFMDSEVKATYDYLYDKKEDLFYRDSRYFNMKTPTGQKMFWSRGNGWAFAALPIILRDMPRDWKTRPFYENLFTKMAVPVKKAQAADGSWHPSLHDEKNPDIKDMSASMFLTFGLMWGINNGYLPEKEYLPVVKKAWTSACECVSDEGALGWVQPIADKPFEYKADSTEVYGSGAFLLAASEIYKYIIKRDHPKLKAIEITNELEAFRPKETITLPMTAATGFDVANLRIFDARNGRAVPHQLIDENGDGKPDSIIFQVDSMAKTIREFWIFDSKTLAPAPTDTVCYSRYVPERMDDFAWENDLTANRTYGPVLMEPAPKGEGLVSSGIDVWCKRVKTPILDEFYKKGNYHKDNGKGLDFYKVGTGRGCGGVAVLMAGKPRVSKNWSKATSLVNGPVRTIFELEYEPWEISPGAKVAEKRRVSLDAGSFFMKSTSTLTIDGRARNPLFGPGLDISPAHDNDAKLLEDPKMGIVVAWGRNTNDGAIGTGLIVPEKGASIKKDADTAYVVVPMTAKPVTWYTGSVWTKAGYVTTPEQWLVEAQNYATRLKSPMKISLKK